MRRISQERVRRRISGAWFAKARDLLSNMAAGSTLERARLIKKNAGLWSEVKDALWLAGGEKCWYSEVVLPAGQIEVEHFRPKGRVSREAFAGYWWLAFDWRNYRIASHLVNTRRTDHLNKGLRGKGSYFPLVAGVRGTYVANPLPNDPLCVASERPLLLDPIDAVDVELLTFDQDGLPQPHPILCGVQAVRERVVRSIEYYSLDDGVLSARRADVWKRIVLWATEMEKLITVSENQELDDVQTGRLSELKNLIADAIDQGAEFSSAAITALRLSGDRGWNTALLEAVA